MRSKLLPLMLPALLLACNDGGSDTGELSDTLDRDNDGFTEIDDCNDLDAQIHPDAIELCDGIDNNCNDQTDEGDAFDATTWFVDNDGDGFGVDGDFIYACVQPDGYSQDRTDCNDGDITAYPGASEVCDGVDNDCDDQTDEGTALDAASWYRDGDGDGYGSELATVTACDQPEGYVDDDTDCNDADEAVNPGATEVCNEIDDDCDTLVDDYDTDTEGGSDFYLDQDGDQWGDESTIENRCVQPLGYVPVPGDCDDTVATTNPDNAEVCGDEVDNDCDDEVDEPDAPHLLAWYTDNDSDGYGSSTSSPVYSCPPVTNRVSNNEDCNDTNDAINPEADETWYDGVDADCDGASDYDADGDQHVSDDYGGDDCEDSEVLAHPGLAEVCGDGLDNDCDGDSDPCGVSATFYGEEAGDRAGGAVGAGGDLDGDGLNDVVIGASWHNGTLLEDVVAVGAAYVAYGPITGTYNLSTAEGKIEGAADQDRLGSSVSIIGDVDDDGYDDVLIGAFGVDTGGYAGGASYLFNGPIADVISADSATATLVGELANDRSGSAVAGGDFDGDNRADFLIGAYENDGLASSAGAVYLVYGPATGTIDLSFADARILGAMAGDWAGFSVANAGDVNGDGEDDILIGAPFAHPDEAYVGAAYVVYGPPDDGDSSLEDADRVYTGINPGDRAGYSVAGAGDINNDGRSDILVGAPNNDSGAEESGAAYLVSGNASSATLTAALATFVGEDADDHVGSAVDGAGDVDGDGRLDVLIGADRDDYADSDAGGAYVVMGPISGAFDLSESEGKVIGEAADDYVGSSLAGAGDMNGDGFDDFVIGAPGNDFLGDNAGAAYLIYGGGF
ncbi:hypothetical protein L6R53_00530 [Myxococcota bacterium]|nr:hypothetical protein [Myxococcota bacterium]